MSEDRKAQIREAIGHFLFIRFFSVRESGGKYLGTMEVVQDLTDIKKLEGERRLLDWAD